MKTFNSRSRKSKASITLLAGSLKESANEDSESNPVSVKTGNDISSMPGVIDLTIDDDAKGWGDPEPTAATKQRPKFTRPTLPRGKSTRKQEAMRKRQARLNKAKSKPTAKRAKPQTAQPNRMARQSNVSMSPLEQSVARINDARRSPAKRYRGPISAKRFGENKDHPDARFIDSLFHCLTVEEVAALHEKWADSFKAKCRIAYKNRKLAPDMRRIIDALIEGTATTSPNLLNLKVLKLSWEHCYRLLWAIAQANPDFQFVLVTIIDGRGATSSYAPFIELADATRNAQSLARAISPNFLGVNELALFKSRTHADGGRHMQTHQHILCFGENVVARAKEIAKKRMFTFEPNVTSAPQIDVRPVEASKVNLARVCAYLFKQPHKSMNWVPGRDGKRGFMNQSEKGERAINYLRVAQIRSMMTIDDTLFAGGVCKAIKSDLVKLLRQSCLSEVPIIGRKLHPDGVQSFWNEVNKALNRPELRLPIIGRNP